MRSIAQAVIWDYTRRARATFLIIGLATTSVPAVTYGLRHMGLPILFDGETLVWLEFIFYVFSLVIFNLGVVSLQGPLPGVVISSGPSRMYALPISTWRLVMGQLLCGTAAVALLYLLMATVINAAFGVGWRLLGPAAIAAVSYLCIQAAVWSTLRLGVMQMAMFAVVGTALFYWAKTHFGPVPGSVEHPFSPIGAAEGIGMALAALLAAGLSIVAIGRDRRGDMQGWGFAGKWNRRATMLGARPQVAFSSPARAQTWYEWREKGWMIPICFIAMHSVIVAIQLLTGDEITDVLRSAPGIGVASVLGAAFGAGMLMGHLNLPRGKVEFTPFLATRPASDLALASATLKTTAAGLAVAWGLWLIMALASGIPLIIVEQVKALGVERFVREELPEIVLLPLGVLAASWILPAVLVPVGMTGRRWLLILALSVPPAVLMCYAFLHVAAPEGLQQTVEEVITNTLLLAMIAGPAIAFYVSTKMGKCLIAVPWAALLWLALWGVPASWFARQEGVGWQFVALLAGLAALMISPLATAPLAVAWNRHR